MNGTMFFRMAHFNLAPRAILKNWSEQRMILREIFAGLNSSIINKSKLIYEMP